jgi:hypothetical protein
VLALGKCRISSIEDIPATGDGWQMVGQFTALRYLSVERPRYTNNFTASQSQALSSLHCLTTLRLGVQLVDFSPLANLTQLKQLNLLLPETSPVQHPEALTHLTALEDLNLGDEFSGDFSIHAPLAHAVGALSSLQQLTTSYVTPGPWTDALERLTGLTKLRADQLGYQDVDCPLHLPSLKVLSTHPLHHRPPAGTHHSTQPHTIDRVFHGLQPTHDPPV